MQDNAREGRGKKKPSSDETTKCSLGLDSVDGETMRRAQEIRATAWRERGLRLGFGRCLTLARLRTITRVDP